MKTVLYGGSFNPPHLGHFRAAETVLKAFEPDTFLIIPDNLPPHKELAEGSPPPEARLAMCRIAFRALSGVTVTDLELRRKGKSYTSDTVELLRKEKPEDELILVIGTDMLLSFQQWHEYRMILSECTLAVLARETGESEAIEKAAQILREEDGAKIVQVPCEPYPASSTEIRAALLRGERPAALDGEVYRYITEHHYYQKTEGEEIQQSSLRDMANAGEKILTSKEFISAEQPI